MRSYVPTEVGGNSQIWAIVQDTRGVIYAGGGGAVLEYDGASWRRIPLPSLVAVARSLDIDAAGRIYVGAVNELGYLEPNAAGEMSYVSLLPKLPPEAREMGVVWRTLVTPEGVVFQTENSLFRWSNGAFTAVAGEVALPPGLDGGRPRLRRPARERAEHPGARHPPPAARHRAAGQRAVPDRPALRPVAAAHRHARRRALPLRRRIAHPVSDRDRRQDQGRPALSRVSTCPTARSR